jgi:hypothetical protein
VIPYTFFRFVIGYAVFPLNMHTKDDVAGAAIAHGPYLIAVFGALLLLGSSLLRRNTVSNPLLLVAGWLLIVPMAIGLLISLKVPMLSERYLIVIFPVFLFTCLASQDFSQRRSVAATGLFFMLLIVGDIAYFANPIFGKAQWRDAASYVERTLDHEGAVLVEPENAAPVFQYYFRGPQPVYAPRLSELPSARPKAESLVHQQISGYRRIVLITSGPAIPQAGLAKFLVKYAERTQTRVFELETGITCTSWELVQDKPIANGQAMRGGAGASS